MTAWCIAALPGVNVRRERCLNAGLPTYDTQCDHAPVNQFWVVARGGEYDGDVGLLQLDGHPIGEHLDYRGDLEAVVPYVVTDEVATLPDGRAAFIAEREESAR